MESSESASAAKEILDTMLGYLGFVVEVEVEASDEEIALQVLTADPEPLLGRNGDRMEDIQYLVNRILQCRQKGATRVRVDVDHYRAQGEDHMIAEAEALAEGVIGTGQPAKLEPMNSYHRRLIHNHFANHPQVKTWSPQDSARLKRITILPKG